MTALYKHRVLLDFDQALNCIQATIELHALDGSTVHRITTHTPEPFDSPYDVLNDLLAEIQQRHGTQPTLPL